MQVPGDDVAARWQVATHLSAAREAEKYVNASRRSVARMRTILSCSAKPLSLASKARKYPRAYKLTHAAHHRREHKKDPHTPHKKSEDLVTNMMSLDMITNRPEEAATPSGSVNRGARRKQVCPQAVSSVLQWRMVIEIVRLHRP